MYRKSRCSVWWILGLFVVLGFALVAMTEPASAIAGPVTGSRAGQITAPEYVPPPPPPPTGEDGGDPDEIGIYRLPSPPEGGALAGGRAGSAIAAGSRIGVGRQIVIWLTLLRSPTRGF